MNIKRVNLYFNADREEDNAAYKLLTKQKKKTDYIINLLLRSNSIITEEIKQLVKEIIEEYNFKPKSKEYIENEERTSIPSNIFDFFEQI